MPDGRLFHLADDRPDFCGVKGSEHGRLHHVLFAKSQDQRHRCRLIRDSHHQYAINVTERPGLELDLASGRLDTLLEGLCPFG